MSVRTSPDFVNGRVSIRSKFKLPLAMSTNINSRVKQQLLVNECDVCFESLSN